MSPSLHDEMARATANARIDADELVTAARRRGLAIRRRRQALATIGTLGVAGAVAALVVTFAPAGNHDQVAGPAGTVSVLPSGFSPTPTAAFTGRSTAAALLYAVQQQSPGGRSADFRWQDPGRDQGETYAVFRFTPAGSNAPGEVGINVQPGMAGDVGNDCSQRFMHHCTIHTLPDGSRLRTYDDLSGKDPAGIRRVAELLRPDGVRVIASASNGLDVTENDEQIDRAAPVLDTRQLSAIVGATWWGPRLPAYFERVGSELTGEGIPSGTSEATALPTPGS
jgi:hypothetical protein